jgi:crotonobetainyl-CoA:carnitine CoA-transferase CaiB-like acyl-CoA transferase
MLIQGLTGIAAATGRGDGPPVPVGSGFSDQIGAMNMVYAILASLYWRERSGEGQEIKIDLLSAMLAHQGQEMLMAMNFGRDFQRPNSGIGHPGMEAPFGVYPTSDGWVTIAMSPYKKLVGVLGDESLLIYDNARDLFEKRDEIWEKLAVLTKKRSTADLMEAMLAVDIWCGEVKTHLQAAQDPQVEHMKAIGRYEHPTAGTVKVVAPAVKLSKTPPEIARAAPLVGQHSREILEEFGFSRAQIDGWIASGGIAQAEVPGA